MWLMGSTMTNLKTRPVLYTVVNCVSSNGKHLCDYLFQSIPQEEKVRLAIVHPKAHRSPEYKLFFQAAPYTSL